MVTHPVDRGDTKRHFDAGADVVIGLGEARLKVTRERGDLDSALADLQAEGVDYAVVEGFKHSPLPKIVMADIDVPNMVRRVMLAEVNEALVEELTQMILGMEDYEQMPEEKICELIGLNIDHLNRKLKHEKLHSPVRRR